jgi:cytochrome c-type biogenesis protein CcmH/NrfG
MSTADKKPDKRGIDRERIIYLVIAALVVIGVVIYYQASGKEAGVDHTHDFLTGENDPALAAMLDRFKQNPDDAENLKDLGNYYYDSRNFTMAEMFYKRYQGINPQDADVLVDLGTALFYSEKPDEAMKCYEDALKINPQHKNALFNMGLVKNELGDREGTVYWWRKFLEVAGDDPHVEPLRKVIAEIEGEAKEGGTAQ